MEQHLRKHLRMSRKDKTNNKKTRKYNKEQFTGIFCHSCEMCDRKKNLSFCYVELYKKNPRKFVDSVFPSLLGSNRELFMLQGNPLRTLSKDIFTNIFCSTGICHDGNTTSSLSCDSIEFCYTMLLSQLSDGEDTTGHKVKSGFLGTGGRKKPRHVCSAYPTSFSSGDKKFAAAVKDILNGSNDIEQDNT